MSWRRISRPAALPGGLESHRADAAEKLAAWYTGGVRRGDLGNQIDFLTGRAPRSAGDLVKDLGGVKQAAAAVGAAERTVRDWVAGQHSPSAKHADGLAKAARRATVTAMGGTKAVAAMTGRSESTVRSWVRKPTQAKGDAVHRLNKHEVRTRHQKARKALGQAPTDPLVMKATGHVRVKATTSTPEYEVDRTVNHQVDETLKSKIEDALARGADPQSVQQLMEADLTGGSYAGLGDNLYDGQEFGFFIDRVDTIGMDTTR